jgi:glutathione synthase/RimK-type ligase-like ATP-grasp enzyme
LAEFDALFIRETTQVDHYTYRFARRAAAEGLVVIDDPDSIIKCTNKVYLAELLDHQRVPTPVTKIVSRDNRESVVEELSFPTIVKQPDSSFSQGVFKADSRRELDALLDQLFEDSELLILQEFVSTPFDWRIGMLNRETLFACKYHMVKSHWQIARSTATRTTYGKVEAVRVDDVPRQVVSVAVRAARAIGDGFYGVDVKQVGRRAVVMEVNDNPNVDAGCEDAVVGNPLYERIIGVFVDRIERRRGRRG